VIPRHISLTFLVAAVVGTLISLATPAVPATPVMKVAVASFNVKHAGKSFDGLSWDTRGHRSAKVIVSLGTQVIGLQELYDGREQYLGWINYYASQAGKGRPYRMTPDPGCDDDCGNDNRIVYNANVFTLLSSGAVKYSSQYCPGGDCESPRMFVWAKLKHLATGKVILFTTTHLSPSSDSVDVAQWEQLRKWVLARKAAASDNPINYIIMTGDFNTSKFESPAKTQLSRMRNSGIEDVLGQQYSSYSTYRNPSVRVDSQISTSNRGDRNTAHYSVANGRNGNGIDYVFVSKALKATYYRVYAQPRTGTVMNYLTSDHFLVRATISQ